jgi:hypothetical protein
MASAKVPLKVLLPFTLTNLKVFMSSSPGVGVSRVVRLTWLIYIGVRKELQETFGKISEVPRADSRGLTGAY